MKCHSERSNNSAFYNCNRFESRSIAEQNLNLGVSDSTLHTWRKQFGRKPDGSRITPNEHEELIRLRRNIKKLKKSSNHVPAVVNNCITTSNLVRLITIVPLLVDQL